MASLMTLRGIHRMITATAFVAACAAIGLTPSAQASTISGTVTGGTAFAAGGTFVKLTPPLPNPFGPPNSVGNDTFQSPNLFAFDELQAVLLAAPLLVDVGANIAAGTLISSQYVFFDPGPTQTVVGTVNFSTTVLAIITSTGNLAASDFLGAAVNYLNPAARGLEAGDVVTISGPNQILFSVAADTPGDYVRVITAATPVAAVPEPSTLTLVGMGVVAFVRRLRSRSFAR